VYQLIQTLPAYPQPSVDYVYRLGYIPYPTWSYACRSNPEYNLYKATDKLMFEAPKQVIVSTVGVVTTCTLILVILLRLFFIIRHIVDLKSKKVYNALMMTEDEIAEQIPNLDLIKSFKKEFCIFLFELLLVLVMAGMIIYSLVILTKESVWIKQVIKYNCTDQYLKQILFYYEDQLDYISRLLV
jgi:hypothetical protein